MKNRPKYGRNKGDGDQASPSLNIMFRDIKHAMFDVSKHNITVLTWFVTMIAIIFL